MSTVSLFSCQSASPKRLGDSSGGVTPVPIPNTEVKPSSPDGTALETGWESRPLPGFTCSSDAPSGSPDGASLFQGRFSFLTPNVARYPIPLPNLLALL